MSSNDKKMKELIAILGTIGSFYVLTESIKAGAVNAPAMSKEEMDFAKKNIDNLLGGTMIAALKQIEDLFGKDNNNPFEQMIELMGEEAMTELMRIKKQKESEGK